jgi:hypothetical protein
VECASGFPKRLADHDAVAGLACWSCYRPEWRLVMLCSRDLDHPAWFRDVRVTGIEVLDIRHPAVQLAAKVLPRRLSTSRRSPDVERTRSL